MSDQDDQDDFDAPSGSDLDPDVDPMLKRSSLYREFQAQRAEVLKHKWIESEKAGRDIGFDHALTDWIVQHRSEWRKNRMSSPKGSHSTKDPS